MNVGPSRRLWRSAMWMIVAVLVLLGAALLWLALQALIAWITLD